MTTAMYDAGYGSSSRLYEKSASQLGMTPGTYGRGGALMNINFTIVDCALGKLLVAGTERGLCSVTLGDDESELEEKLRTEFRDAELNRDTENLDVAVKAIVEYLSGQLPELDLPLDIRATAFQRRVWEELQKIPYGDTRSYGDVAAAIGQPTASRAVARACATNPVALVVPCHRVVREGGAKAGTVKERAERVNGKARYRPATSLVRRLAANLSAGPCRSRLNSLKGFQKIRVDHGIPLNLSDPAEPRIPGAPRTLRQISPRQG